MKKRYWIALALTFLLQYSCHKKFSEEERPVVLASTKESPALLADLGPIPVVVDPNRRYQIFKGFGVSLAWWANDIGGWDDATLNSICNDLTSSDELNLNFFRYNIGGGDNPTHQHMWPEGGEVPGYKASATAPYNWQADSNQLRILKKLYQLKSSAVYEAVSYSPPYWMTNSGCSSGGVNGAENLQSNSYGTFASYLTDVVKHLKEVEGINISRLEPMNEPYNPWPSGGHQEGCKILQSNQKKLIDSLYNKLSAKGMLAYCKIAAMDAFSIDQAVTSVNTYINGGSINKVEAINTHSYTGTQRTQLHQLAQANGKEIWQTESEPIGVTGPYIDRDLVMALRVQTDIRDMQVSGWTDWQAMSGNNNPAWNYWLYDRTARTVQRAKKYYFRKQFSKFLQPGFTIIYSTDSTTAALNSSNNQLVVVLTNADSVSKSYNLDLNLFASSGTVSAYRTSETEDCANLGAVSSSNNQVAYTAPSKSVTTFIIPVTLATSPIANGTYKIALKSNGNVLNAAGNGSANGTNIIQYPWVNTPNEKFIVTLTSQGYKIMPSYITNNRVIQVSGASLADDAWVNLFDDVSAYNERFSIIEVGGGCYRIVARHSGKCFYVPPGSGSSQVFQYSWQNTDNMKWSFTVVN